MCEGGALANKRGSGLVVLRRKKGVLESKKERCLGKTKSCPKAPRGEEPGVLREAVLPGKCVATEQGAGLRGLSWAQEGQWRPQGQGKRFEFYFKCIMI